MSLKAFHIFFIGCAEILALGSGALAIVSYAESHNVLSLIAGIGSVIAAIGLIIYGILFLKKLKGVSFL
ncbi:MAG TPA: hypothetical protein VLY03_00320 [Bacteroidota bacterium]|nr:hypothetical protein [Bacteroidota bacterium]